MFACLAFLCRMFACFSSAILLRLRFLLGLLGSSLRRRRLRSFLPCLLRGRLCRLLRRFRSHFCLFRRCRLRGILFCLLRGSPFRLFLGHGRLHCVRSLFSHHRLFRNVL